VLPLETGDSTTDGAARLSIVDGRVQLEIYSRDLGGYATFTGLLTPAAATSDLKDAMVAGGLIDPDGASGLDLEGGALAAGETRVDELAVTGTATLEGDLVHTGSAFGVYGVTPVDRPGATEDIKDALASLGLLTNGGASPLNLDAGAIVAGAASFTTMESSGNAQAGGILYANGGFRHIASTLLFWDGTGHASKPTVTGSRGGNAALASLLTALATYGLITDSSS
jgi:hypothetical protein